MLSNIQKCKILAQNFWKFGEKFEITRENWPRDTKKYCPRYQKVRDIKVRDIERVLLKWVCNAQGTGKSSRYQAFEISRVNCSIHMFKKQIIENCLLGYNWWMTHTDICCLLCNWAIGCLNRYVLILGISSPRGIYIITLPVKWKIFITKITFLF